MQEFESTIQKDDSGRLTFIELPFNAKKVFNMPKGSIHVAGSINEVPYRLKLLSIGNNKQVMQINKVLQKQLEFTGEPMPVMIKMMLEDEIVNPTVKTDAKLLEDNNKVLEIIKSRRSIRKYKDSSLSKKQINTILYAGLCSPSAKNKRPVHFVVIQDKEILEELSNNNTNARMLADAPCCIVICGDRAVESTTEFLHGDCFAATQNMLLCIQSMGLGGAWCGVKINSDWYKQITCILKLPIKVVPLAVISLGVPDESKEEIERFDKSKIHLEKW